MAWYLRGKGTYHFVVYISKKVDLEYYKWTTRSRLYYTLKFSLWTWRFQSASNSFETNFSNIHILNVMLSLWLVHTWIHKPIKLFYIESCRVDSYKNHSRAVLYSKSWLIWSRMLGGHRIIDVGGIVSRKLYNNTYICFIVTSTVKREERHCSYLYLELVRSVSISTYLQMIELIETTPSLRKICCLIQPI